MRFDNVPRAGSNLQLFITVSLIAIFLFIHLISNNLNNIKTLSFTIIMMLYFSLFVGKYIATISYRIRKSKSEYSTIYAHLRIPGGRVVELSTTLSVLPEQWSASKQLVKNKIAENKKLNSSLVILRTHPIQNLF